MATLFQIPTASDQTWFVQTITLSGTTYCLELRYNTRMGRWMLNILNASEQPILMGLPLLIQRSLTSQYTTLALPEGLLFCTDESGNNLQPTLSSFLLDHVFWYVDTTA